MNSAGQSNISSIFQHGLQDGYLSLNSHVKGGLFPLSDVIWGSEVKTSDLAAHFSRNSGAADTVCLLLKRSTNIQTWQIKSTVFTRPHAMKRHKIMSPMLRNRDS